MTSGREGGFPRAWVWALALALVGFSYYSTLAWLVMSWLGNTYYSHGFLVPAVSLVLAWRLQAHPPAGAGNPAASGRAFAEGLVLTGVGLGVHLVAASRGAHLLSAVTLAPVLSGVVLALGGLRTLRRLVFPLGFLFLMVPLPILERSTPELARWVAATAGAICRAAGLQVVVTGARVALPTSALVIGAPCSGVNSLAALFTLAVLYAFLLRGPLVAREALPALALPIALLANLARICLLVVVAHYAGTDAALQAFHGFTGPVFFLLGLGALVLVGRWLGCSEIRSDI